jgi:hypothetical protein
VKNNVEGHQSYEKTGANSIEGTTFPRFTDLFPIRNPTPLLSSWCHPISLLLPFGVIPASMMKMAAND